MELAELQTHVVMFCPVLLVDLFFVFFVGWEPQAGEIKHLEIFWHLKLYQTGAAVSLPVRQRPAGSQVPVQR